MNNSNENDYIQKLNKAILERTASNQNYQSLCIIFLITINLVDIIYFGLLNPQKIKTTPMMSGIEFDNIETEYFVYKFIIVG